MSSAPVQFSYQEIVSVTNNFDDVNVIGKGGLGKVYKAKVSQSGEPVDVAVRRIDHSYWLQDNAFAKEIEILSKLKHKNLISLVGFCDENDEILVINKHAANASLFEHLSDPTLTWMRRLKISAGVASALKYMHNHSVIHHNVSSTTILLDENWEAKLSGFEFCMVIQEGHLDPAYERIGVGSYKSDTFSFGIVLFQILCGMKAFLSKDGTFQAPLAIFQYEDRKLHKLVDQDLYKQMDPQSFNIFSAVAYDCLKERRAPPNMNQVLQRLEKALNFQEKYENHEHSSTVVRKGPSNEMMSTVVLEYVQV
ncbi:kinase-like domain-containing protein [Tanacetum coccineum]|uniref:Kinase-like domain-containing protein n=1 Tax=Tanacetum coccineum TaxID=301880 RepID=A0ABQ5B498_9ASTR